MTSVPSWQTASQEVAILTAATDTCLTLLANAPQLAMNMTTAVQTNTHATVPYTEKVVFTDTLSEISLIARNNCTYQEG